MSQKFLDVNAISVSEVCSRCCMAHSKPVRQDGWWSIEHDGFTHLGPPHYVHEDDGIPCAPDYDTVTTVGGT